MYSKYIIRTIIDIVVFEGVGAAGEDNEGSSDDDGGGRVGRVDVA